MEKISKPKSKLKYVVLFIVLFFVFCGNRALAAALFLSPGSGEYSTGQGFKVVVYVASSDQAINALSGTIHFPPNLLSVVSLSKAGSIISNWVSEPSFSNSAGTVNFEGIILNPGYTGSAGNILTINFRGNAAGAAALSIGGGSVLANDGAGTEVYSGSSGANYNISQPAAADPAAPVPPPPPATVVAGGITVSSASHPDSEKWSSQSDVVLSWNRPDNLYGYSFVLDQNPTTVPDNTLETTTTTTKSYPDVADGIWYFHIKGRPQPSSSAFRPATHYKIQIDTAPPATFELKVAESTVTFETTDALSGIERFQALVDGQVVSENVSSPYTFENLKIGSRNLQIIAIDKAGNQTAVGVTTEITHESSGWSLAETVTIPWYLLLLMNLVILILLGIIVKLLLARRSRRRNDSGNAFEELQADMDLSIEKLRNQMEGRLLELKAKSLDELVKRESKIAKIISADIKKSKALIDKKIDQSSRKS